MFKTTSLTVDATYLESLLSSVSVKSVRSVRMLDLKSSQNVSKSFIYTYTPRRDREKKVVSKQTKIVLHRQGSGNGNAKKFRKDDVFQNLFSQCKSVRSVRCPMSLLLPSYMLERRKPVPNTLFTLWSVESTVFPLRTNFIKCLYLLLSVVVSPFLYYLYVCLRDVGVCFHSKICNLEVHVDTPQSCGECLMRKGSTQLCYSVVTVKLHTPRLVQACFI